MQTLDELVKERARLAGLVTKYQDKLYRVRKEIGIVCDHPSTRIDEEYEEGSYYNRSQYHTVTYCNVCGKELGRLTKTGSYV